MSPAAEVTAAFALWVTAAGCAAWGWRRYGDAPAGPLNASVMVTLLVAGAVLFARGALGI